MWYDISRQLLCAVAAGASTRGMQLGEHHCTPVQYLPLALEVYVIELFLFVGRNSTDPIDMKFKSASKFFLEFTPIY